MTSNIEKLEKFENIEIPLILEGFYQKCVSDFRNYSLTPN